MIANSCKQKRSGVGHLNNELANVDFKSCLKGTSTEWNFFTKVLYFSSRIF